MARGEVQRAVQDLHVGMLDGNLRARRKILRRCREEYVVPVGDQLLHRLHCIFRCNAEHGLGVDPLAEDLIDIFPAELVGVGPGADLLRFLVHPRGCVGLRGHEHREGVLLRLGDRVERDRDRAVVTVEFKLVPDLRDVVAELRGESLLRFLVAEDAQVHEERVRRRERELVAALREKFLAEGDVGGAEVRFHRVVPRLFRVVVGRLQQKRVAAFLREGEVVDLRLVVKVQKLVVHLNFLRIGTLRDDAGHKALNRHGAHAERDAHAFVALLDVVFVQEFVGDDRVAHALGLHGLVEVGPFHGKFRVLVEERHKVAREGVAARLVVGSRDLLDRNVRETELDAAVDLEALEHVVQTYQIRVDTLGYAVVVLLFSGPFGLDVFFNIHSVIFFLMRFRGTGAFLFLPNSIILLPVPIFNRGKCPGRKPSARSHPPIQPPPLCRPAALRSAFLPRRSRRRGRDGHYPAS